MEPQAKAKAFIDFLVGVGDGQYNKDATTFLKKTSPVSTFLAPADEKKAFSSIMNSNSKNTDAFNVTISPVKYVLNEIVHCLLHIYNLSLTTSFSQTK